MHFAHARAQSYTGMAISCVDLISVCRMHFLGGVISPQGSAGGCHESRLYCRPPPPSIPPPPPPPRPPPVDNHQLASRTWQIRQPLLITFMPLVADWMSGCNHAYSLFSFLWFSPVARCLLKCCQNGLRACSKCTLMMTWHDPCTRTEKTHNIFYHKQKSI